MPHLNDRCSAKSKNLYPDRKEIPSHGVEDQLEHICHIINISGRSHVRNANCFMEFGKCNGFHLVRLRRFLRVSLKLPYLHDNFTTRRSDVQRKIILGYHFIIYILYQIGNKMIQLYGVFACDHWLSSPLFNCNPRFPGSCSALICYYAVFLECPRFLLL